MAFRQALIELEMEGGVSARGARYCQNYDFQIFYACLSQKGHVIYPGKLSHADCFRIGHIGRLGVADVRALLAAIAETLVEMDINLSV